MAIRKKEKMEKAKSLIVLFAVFSIIAITPSAFADHTTATVTNAPGS